MKNKPKKSRNKKVQENTKQQDGPPNADATTTTTTHKNADHRRRRRHRRHRSFLSSFGSLGLAVFLTGLGLPWGLHKAYTYLFLQRPDVLAHYFLVSLRPAVTWTHPRRLLIVGTLSGGTTQVATDLQTLLGLEICHETMDCAHYACRDGTVSWFHGIRFVPRPSSTSDQALQEALDLQCANYTSNMGVHPGLFTDTSHIPCTQPSITSLFLQSSSSWSACWADVCRDWIRREWGCALQTNNNNHNDKNDKTACPTPLFDVVLHQVRHPLRTIESLVAKFCHRTHATMHPDFAKFPQAWFGRHGHDHNHNHHHHHETDNTTISDDADLSCLLVAGRYVVDYHNAMLRAKEAGLVHDMYRIEDTSPCQVAEMAGWMDDATLSLSSSDDTTGPSSATTIWPKSRQQVLQKCRDATTTTMQKNPKASMTSTLYKVNRGAVSLTYANFTVDAASRTLWEQLVVLTKALGYPPLEQQQQVDSGDAQREVDHEL